MMLTPQSFLLVALGCITTLPSYSVNGQGIFLGTLSTNAHRVAGDVYLLSLKVLEIRDFTYDGTAPAAYFWADTSASPSNGGQILSDGSPSKGCAMQVGDPEVPGSEMVSQRVEFPSELTILDFLGGSLSVWCEAFAENFGSIVFPNAVDESEFPADVPILECSTSTPSISEPYFLGTLSTLAHLVTGDVYLLGENVLEIQGFSYDGTAPAAYFWADTNPTPSINGQVLSDGSPSNGCAMQVGDPQLPELTSATQRIEFPHGLTIRDFLGGSLSVWCASFAANFGSLKLPSVLDESAIPTTSASLECTEEQGESNVPLIAQVPEGYNCEPLNDIFQVRWKVNEATIDLELIASIPSESYMSFGISGAVDRTLMIGADVVVADIPSNGGVGARARDFFMDARAQCDGIAGVCSDSESGFVDDITSVSGEQDYGLTLVRYTRPLVPSDIGSATSPGSQTLVDKNISIAAGVPTFIAWALGPIDPSTGNPFFHSIGYSRQDGNDVSLEFGRAVVNNCNPLAVDGTQAPTASPATPFVRPFIGDDEMTFNMHIGPSGGPRGYTSITEGLVSWGIAWYVNGYLIPELVMRRGTKYTFRINGGNNSTDSANYHPFYLTTSMKGGYFQLSPEDRLNETPLAGIEINETNSTTGGVLSFDVSGLGPICRYETTAASSSAESLSFDEYAATLNTSCANDDWITNQAGIIEFTPNESTPDIIYYHCVTHFNLGYRIRVIDADAAALTLSPTSSPTSIAMGDAELEDGFQTVKLQDQIADGRLQIKFNKADSRADGLDTISVIFETPVLAWVGWGVSNNGGFMVGSEAVLGIPETGQVLKYNLGGQNIAGVQPMPDERQTLIDASVVQVNGKTILKFTKILIEPDEIPIHMVGENTFISSWGIGNNLGIHAARGSYLLSGQALATRRQKLWKAHGWLAAIAWGILCPLAVASSIFRQYFPREGLWFQFHQGLNMMVIMFTTAAFVIAVVAINQETPDGVEKNHSSKTISNGHRTIGLVIFILAMLQALGGILRPHYSIHLKPTDEENGTDVLPPEPKSLSRVVWENFHKVAGISILCLCWYQVQLGIKTYSNIFHGGELGAALTTFWVIAGTFATMILGGYALTFSCRLRRYLGTRSS